MPSSRWSCRCGRRWSKDSALHSCLQPDQGGGVWCGIWVQGKVVLLHPAASGMTGSQLAGRQLESMIPMRSSRSGQAEWYDHPSSHLAVHKVFQGIPWGEDENDIGDSYKESDIKPADLIYWWSKAEAAQIFSGRFCSCQGFWRRMTLRRTSPSWPRTIFTSQLTTSPIVDDFIAWTTCLIKDKYLIFTVSRHNYIFVYTSIYDVPLHLNVFGWF